MEIVKYEEYDRLICEKCDRENSRELKEIDLNSILRMLK
jgi:hypothetical protein